MNNNRLEISLESAEILISIIDIDSFTYIFCVNLAIVWHKKRIRL